MQVKSSIGKIEGYGKIIKAKKIPEENPEIAENAKPIEAKESDTLELKQSNLKEFDDNQIADPRKNSKVEGGRSIARSTGVSGLSQASAPSEKLGIIQKEQKNMYELGGFTASYTIPGSTDISSSDVRVYFKNYQDAHAAVKGDKYTHKVMATGDVLEMTITKGMPEISVNEILKFKYIEETWERI